MYPYSRILKLSYELSDDTGAVRVKVDCAPLNSKDLTMERQGAFKSKLLDLIVTVVSRVFMLGDKEAITKLFKDERAIERSLDFTMSFVTIGNVLGDSPKFTLDRWQRASAREYVLLRKEPWDTGLLAKVPENGKVANAKRSSSATVEYRARTHQDIVTVSMIRAPLDKRRRIAASETSDCSGGAMRKAVRRRRRITRVSDLT